MFKVTAAPEAVAFKFFFVALTAIVGFVTVNVAFAPITFLVVWVLKETEELAFLKVVPVPSTKSVGCAFIKLWAVPTFS